jgi:hypothetical protein
MVSDANRSAALAAMAGSEYYTSRENAAQPPRDFIASLALALRKGF